MHDDGIVEVVRSGAVIDELDEFVEAMRQIQLRIQAEVDRGTNARAILIDSRAAPSRNDEAFESSTAPYRNAIRTVFPHSAVLVRSEVGRLQINRLERESTGRAQADVFTDRDEALAYLRRA